MSSERYNISTTALLIGVPVLVGASCYYLYFTRNKSSSSKVKADNKKLSPSEQLAQIKKIGNQYFARKNYDVAIEHYTKAIDLASTLDISIEPDVLAVFYQNRAACNEALSQYDKVIEDCDRAIQLNKSYTKAYLRRARALEKLSRYDEAMVDAFAANILEKFQNQASMVLTDNIVRASSQVKASEAMKKHKFDWPSNHAITAFFSAFTHDPIIEKLGGETIKSPQQLQPIWDEAKKPENDQDPMSLLIRGSCLYLMGDAQSAQEALDKLLAIDDSNCSPRMKANALIKKSAMLVSEPSSSNSTIEKDLESVNEMIERSIKLDPENPDVYLHKAQALLLSEKLDEASETLDKAIALKSDFHSATAQKFYIQFKLATRDSASSSALQDLLDEFKSTVEQNPGAFDLHQTYAQALVEMGYFEQADQLLLNLAKANPTDGNIHISRALLQVHLQSGPEAIANYLHEALKVDPKIIYAYEVLGSIESQRGRHDEAIRIFEKALDYANSEAVYARCFSQLDSAKGHMAAMKLLGMQT